VRYSLIFSVIGLCFVAQLNLWGQSYDPKNSLSIGSVTLTLHMSESDVVKRLSSEFDVRSHSETGGISSWQVCEKGNKDSIPCPATVTFSNGKLVEAVHRWPEAGTTAEFARFLSSLAARFIKEGNTSCRLDAVQLRDQFSTDDSTLIICGNKQLRIGFITPDPHAPPYILEVVQGLP
jgi:hypothetical protein